MSGLARLNNMWVLFFFILLLVFAMSITSVLEGDLDPFVNYQSHQKRSQEFNFVVAGDFGCGEEAKKTVGTMVSKKPELVIALGDLAYKKNPDCWFSLISPLEMNNKSKISFGEHEISRGNVTYNQFLKHYNLTKPYYSFDYKKCSFLSDGNSKE